MIHTLYSNSYEVLRAVLLSNIERLRFRPEASELGADALFEGVFDRVPVIIPSKAVETDLTRAIAREEQICASMQFMFLSQWLGFFSKEPLANVVGNEADWMVWEILRKTGPGSFREEMKAKTVRLEDCLRGRTVEEVFSLAQRICSVFVSYASYRLDWVLEWLGLHQERLTLTEEMQDERRRMEADPDFVWQRELWKRLAENPRWRGRQFLETLPETLESLAGAPKELRELDLGHGRTVPLPNALHVFMPFVVPPLMLPVLKAFAHSGRDVWLYLLNPSSEYWFDLVPKRLFNWKEKGDGHREIGHPILADNGRSVRANIDRLWRFTEEDIRETLLSGPSENAHANDSAMEPRERRILASRDILRDYQLSPKNITVDMKVDAESIYLEANEPTLLRRIQDSILKLDPDLSQFEEKAVREEDESLRFVCAPTAVRELEGLADWLQAQFRKRRDLRPEDVLVVTPDISASAPLIDQVFGSLPAGRRIDYRITGALMASEDAPLEALSGLANLLTGRMKRGDFLAWLSLPLISRRFGFEADDLETLSAWLASAGFEFGLSDGHLLSLDAETFRHVRESTLSRALERLALGVMLPGGVRKPFLDVLPREGVEARGWSTAAERPELLNALSTIYAALEKLRREAEDADAASSGDQNERGPRRWTRWISEALECFFPRETPQENWQSLRAGAEALAIEIEAAENPDEGAPEVPFRLFMSALRDRLAGAQPGGRPGSGVTFTGMQQLRGLPYKVIVICGLNDDSRFPGSSHAEEFDLMARFPRRGDRDSRHDNRNIFLDLLLAARETFLISYAGGVSDAERKEPSIVAQELREWILSFAENREERRQWAGMLTRTLALTGFSPNAFRDLQGDWRSTDADLLTALRDAAKENWRKKELPFEDAARPLPEAGDQVPFTTLWKFWRDPANSVLKENGIGIDDGEEDEEVPLVPSAGGLSFWKRTDEALRAFFAGESEDDVRRRWALNPGLGARGVREWALEEDLAIALALFDCFDHAMKNTTEVAPQMITADLPGLSWKISMQTSDLRKHGETGNLLFAPVTASAVTGSRGQRAAWEFLVMRAAGLEVNGCLVSREKEKDEYIPVISALAPITADAAARILAVLGRLWEASLSGNTTVARAPFEGKGAEDESHANLIAFRGKKLAEAEKRLKKAADLLQKLYARVDGEVLAHEFEALLVEHEIGGDQK